MESFSLRYGHGRLNLRNIFIKICAWLQKKPILILDSDPQLCSKILAASELKGTFIEHIFAIPAWRPIYSIESEDGTKWEQLASSCSDVLRKLRWKEALPIVVSRRLESLVRKAKQQASWVLGAEEISRLSLNILYELLFEQEPSLEDEFLFYKASVEWRKEIAVKGSGDAQFKEVFYKRFLEILSLSAYKEGLAKFADDPTLWLSVFAQPFIISPQINISDIMVAVFHFIKTEPGLYEKALKSARIDDKAYLNGIVMEAIRLRHPFPILERELSKDMEIQGKIYKAGTQVMILLDEFKQDQDFRPERWVQNGASNPYLALPFGAGRRMCLGKALATNLLQELLKAILISFPLERIRPDFQHVYSGRDNDKSQSFAESLYQMKKFAGALLVSFKLGRQKVVRCPFKPGGQGHRPKSKQD